MQQDNLTRYTAFAGSRRIASGELAAVVLQTKAVIDRGTEVPVLIFDEASSAQIEVDFRGTAEEVLHRLPAPADARAADVAPLEQAAATLPGPGRPKLGVVAREVTLLPRHWEWLNAQPGGASVALRKLVEQARHVNERADRRRQAQEAAYRFISVMAGDLPNFEEATRALFSGNRERFEEMVMPWPVDVRDHAIRLAAIVFEPDGA